MVIHKDDTYKLTVSDHVAKYDLSDRCKMLAPVLLYVNI